jgi:hypothetical protein
MHLKVSITDTELKLTNQSVFSAIETLGRTYGEL